MKRKKIEDYFEKSKKNSPKREESSDSSNEDSKNAVGGNVEESVKVCQDPQWTTIDKNNLKVDYAIIFDRSVSKHIFDSLEKEISYFTGELTKIKVFGKVYPIPRQQSAYGDSGVKYKYSGTTVPALPWTHTLEEIRDILEEIVGVKYNFVLVNRYKDGNDKMGDHKDDEKEIDQSAPIASLTFGAERDFVFKHQDKTKLDLENVKIVLKDGMLLLMKHPTNTYWYHGLPPRKSCLDPRINLTFRKIKN